MFFYRVSRCGTPVLYIGERKGYPVFSLRVRVTFDFKQKLLSMGGNVEVLKPESLRNEMREEAKQMLLKYQEED